MRKIIYYVATSLDGYIAGKNEDISQFMQQGEGVEKYKADLVNFGTVIMGRKTYEFGYQYGLKPGQAAYPHMEHHIFSNSLKIDTLADTVYIEKLNIDRVKEIQQQAKTDIYLCGGGEFAAWLLEHGMIDQLKIKLNPIVLGGGTKLFGSSTISKNWELAETEAFSEGLLILTYNKRN
ncbi:MAG: dihydrofolate reductase family protein [Bacteroidota bacterium]